MPNLDENGGCMIKHQEDVENMKWSNLQLLADERNHFRMVEHSVCYHDVAMLQWE